MSDNPYMSNRQKMLFMVAELHSRGFGKLRIIPSISPSGMQWRCEFISEVTKDIFPASDWIGDVERNPEKSASIDIPHRLADVFEEEHAEFLEKCKGDDEEYSTWYKGMVNKLVANELPYAFSDYFGPTDYWQTSANNTIIPLRSDRSWFQDSRRDR